MGKKPRAFGEPFELAVAFFPKPYEFWLSGNLHLQKLVLRLTFADHLAYSPKKGGERENYYAFQALRVILREK